MEAADPASPARAVYLCNRAAALLKMGDHAATVKDCTAAVGIDPQYIKVCNVVRAGILGY